ARETMSKVARRLIPFMIAMFCVNFLDRVNIGFAALQMNHDLGLTPQAFGLAAGILFVSYTLCEIPSNLILVKVGPRRWLARIMVTWGMIAMANALVSDRDSLYLMRFLLGVAEAGFFPGIMVFISRWFPSRERARAITLFMIGSPLSVVFGAPLSTALLSLHGWAGLKGWQWLFVLEGLPAVVLGVIAWRWLTDRPEEATWLRAEERGWLAATLAEEARRKEAMPGPRHTGAVFLHGPTLLLAASKLCVLLAFFGITLWLPQIIRAFSGATRLQTGLLTALPYACAAVGSVLVGRSSDRSGERGLHIALPAFLGALGFGAAALTSNPYLAMAALCVAATGLWISNTVFWTLPTAILAGTPAAAGLALINSVGNFGGFFGPTLTGWVREHTGSYALALLALGFFLALSGVLVLLVARAPGSRGPGSLSSCPDASA
ncbi:MAG TPA: MFS transporter, partial [Steroidobacteraceae bacterium]|nr:MFS transporter [Steroidobacteraceae bacterium]